MTERLAEKPLNVQVAEALGYGIIEPCEKSLDETRQFYHFEPESGSRYRPDFAPIFSELFDGGDWHRCSHGKNRVPPYGEDTPQGWAWTGPLIQRFGIHLGHKTVPDGRVVWIAVAGDIRAAWAEVAGLFLPADAIARCVLALAAAGKLPKEPVR